MGKGPITIRGLTDVVRERLAAMAEAEDRSLEAEVRRALSNWVQQPEAPARTHRARDLACRLRYALEQANAPGLWRFGRRDYIPSLVAEEIGEESAGQTLAWFQGEEEAPFSKLEDIANLLGVSSEWLMHGIGRPYQNSGAYEAQLTNIDGAIRWLFGTAHGERPTKRLGFLRVLNAAGNLLVYKQFNDCSARIYSTPYHISDHIGAGGEGDLMSLYVMWRALHEAERRKTYLAPELGSISSYVIDARIYARLIERQENPAPIIEALQIKHWWEDLWDRSMLDRGDRDSEYWDGYTALWQGIGRYVLESTQRNKELELIINGSHPILQRRIAVEAN